METEENKIAARHFLMEKIQEIKDEKHALDVFMEKIKEIKDEKVRVHALEELLRLLIYIEKEKSQKRIELLTKERTDFRESVDRIQAIVRTPEYKKACEELDSRYQYDEESEEVINFDEMLQMELEMEEKYGIHPMALDLEGNINWEFYGDDIKYILTRHENPAVRVIKAGERKNITDENGKYIGSDYSPCLFEGRDLFILIDLTYNRKIIDAEVKETIDFYKKHVKVKKTSTKGCTLSPWIIYDLHHRDKLNFLQIAKKISGIEKSPAYDKRVMACYKQVKRAYEKAKQMIEQASQTIANKK